MEQMFHLILFFLLIILVINIESIIHKVKPKLAGHITGLQFS